MHREWHEEEPAMMGPGWGGLNDADLPGPREHNIYAHSLGSHQDLTES